MHIGLIGGIGPAATEFYYRGLIKWHSAANRRLNLTIVHADTNEMVRNLEGNAPAVQAKVFAAFAEQLKAGGVDAVAITSMGGHFCVAEFTQISVLPVINAIPILNSHFSKMGIERVGLLGTKTVMRSQFYGGLSSVDVVAPPASELDRVHQEYISMAKSGEASEAQKKYFDEAGRKLCHEQGADVIVLAGTDLFLAFGDEDHGYPIVDSADVHIQAITQMSLSDP